MKIRGLHIDGYGVHHDLGIDDLPDGLTIVCGPNEAGKTTLQHFLVGMLFGFTPSNRPDHHAPLRGGTYGGRLHLEAEGRSLTVHRGARKSSLRITGPDGPEADGELADLLGGATRDLYESIFAVHVEELAELKALTDDQVRDRVFSAGILGAGRTAQAALSSLTAERDLLFKPRGRGDDRYEIKRLRAELATARGQVAEAQREARGLPGLVHRIEVIERDRRSVRTRRDQLETERSLLVAVSELWPAWAGAAEARTALTRLGAVADVPEGIAERLANEHARVDDLAGVLATAEQARAEAIAERDALPSPGAALERAQEIDALAAGLAAERERVAAIAERRAHLAHVDQQLDEALAALGAGRDRRWVEARVHGPEASAELRAAAGALHEATARREQTLERHRHTAADLADARAELDAAHESLAATTYHPAERARAALQDATALVDLVGRRSLAAQRLAAPAEAPATPMTAHLPAAAAVLAAVGALVIGQVLVAVVALLAAVGLAVALRRPAAPVADDRADQELADLDAELAPVLAALGLTQRPTPGEAANLRARAEHLATDAAHHERALADLDRRRAALAERIERQAARRATEQAEADQQVVAAQQAWTAQLTAFELPADLDPAGAADLVVATDRARALATQQRTARTQLEQTVAQASRYRDRVRALVDDPELVEPLAAVERLAEDLQADRAAEHRLQKADAAVAAAEAAVRSAAERAQDARASLNAVIAETGAATLADACVAIERAETAAGHRATIARAERDLTTRVGNDPARVEQARALLGQADPTRWEGELARSRQELADLDDQLDDLTTERAHLLRERDQLERSADVPATELRVADLEAQLVDAVARWASLTLANQLVEGTLARYQRERQPDVVKRAAARFEQITDGRYRRLEIRDQDLIAIDDRGREVPAGALSRGTVEQLYLCMRFALAESFSRTAPLPLLLDDITVNADGGRHTRLAATIADVAATQQVFVFTCHDATVAQLQAAAPAARVVELQPSTAARRLGLSAG